MGRAGLRWAGRIGEVHRPDAEGTPTSPCSRTELEGIEVDVVAPSREGDQVPSPAGELEAELLQLDADGVTKKHAC